MSSSEEEGSDGKSSVMRVWGADGTVAGVAALEDGGAMDSHQRRQRRHMKGDVSIGRWRGCRRCRRLRGVGCVVGAEGECAHVRYDLARALAVSVAGDEHFDCAARGVASAGNEQLNERGYMTSDV